MEGSVIKKVSYTHEDIMNVLIANPFATLAEIAAITGYSVPWLSQLINSDIFRAQFNEKRGEVFVAIMQDVPAKLNALAHRSIDRLAEKLEVASDPDFILDAFDKVMHRNGYAPSSQRQPGALQVQQNNFFVSPADLQAARQRMLNHATASAPPAPTLDVIPEYVERKDD